MWCIKELLENFDKLLHQHHSIETVAAVIESKGTKKSSGECNWNKLVAPFFFVGVTFMFEGVVVVGRCGVPVERMKEEKREERHEERERK